MYFEKFPRILYDYNIGSNTEYKVVTDITRNVRVIKEILSNITIRYFNILIYLPHKINMLLLIIYTL